MIDDFHFGRRHFVVITNGDGRTRLQGKMFFILIALPLLLDALNLTETKTSVVHLVQNLSDINSIFESLPKECTKNGKTYKEGEEFQIGNLRYKCQKYGVYSIEGCVTQKKKNLKIGEVVVIDNVKSQCFAKGDTVFYRETVCGILGQPECDKIDLPSGFREAMKAEDTKPKGKEISIPGLPTGWSVVDETHQEIPGTNGKHVVSRTLIFHPIASQSRTSRQTGRGVGSVVAIEDVGTERPAMPMSMLLNGGKSSAVFSNRIGPPVSQTLNMLSNNGDRIVGVGTGSRDLLHRTPTVSNTRNLKPETVAGSRSDVNWSGKTITVNGRTIAAGPGTFTFGTSPTGTFLKKEQ